ncbi:MAG: hypothetical protein NTY02_03600 [Acidobacteria bacterium]|nr:hypothetical protein [Acidobacteriota bacterium]
MSDRKYRQRGYQDDDRDRAPKRDGDQGAKPKPRPEDRSPGPRTPNMPGFRTVVRCHRCGNLVNAVVLVSSTCTKCNMPLHCCAQCDSFNPAARYECMQTIPARISPKDALTTCNLFEARSTVERETGSVRQTTARSAFDDLFKI